MQKCFLVSGKNTMIRDYFTRRSIMEVVDERRNLSDIDLNNMGIVDIDKFIYIYYGSDDYDMSFRADLNVLRQMLNSPFFHADDGIFILVDGTNAMLEDYIKSACRGTSFVGNHLRVIHHKGALTLNDISGYMSGDVYGEDVVSSYRTVYIRESDNEEHDRFLNSSSDLQMILPVLTDQYAMYAKRAKVEALSSATTISEPTVRPQFLQDFTVTPKASVKRWNAFLISGDLYTNFQLGVKYLTSYFGKMGLRTAVVDLTDRFSNHIELPNSRLYSLPELRSTSTFAEQSAFIRAKFSNLGYVFEMIENIEGVAVYLFVCEPEKVKELQSYLTPICDKLYTNYTTHYCEESLQDFLASNLEVSTLFLSNMNINKAFNIEVYRESFKDVRVAWMFQEDIADLTAYYNNALGVKKS